MYVKMEEKKMNDISDFEERIRNAKSFDEIKKIILSVQDFSPADPTFPRNDLVSTNAKRKKPRRSR